MEQYIAVIKIATVSVKLQKRLKNTILGSHIATEPEVCASGSLDVRTPLNMFTYLLLTYNDAQVHHLCSPFQITANTL